MDINKLEHKVPEQHKEEFCKFVNTGEGTKEFQALIDSGKELGAAFDEVLEKQDEGFREIARILSSGKQTKAQTKAKPVIFQTIWEVVFFVLIAFMSLACISAIVELSVLVNLLSVPLFIFCQMMEYLVSKC